MFANRIPSQPHASSRILSQVESSCRFLAQREAPLPVWLKGDRASFERLDRGVIKRMAQDIEIPARLRAAATGNRATTEPTVASIRQRLDRLVAAQATAAGWTGEDVEDIARRGSILFFSALATGHTPAEALEHAAGNAENEYAIEFVESATDRGESMDEAYEFLLGRRFDPKNPMHQRILERARSAFRAEIARGTTVAGAFDVGRAAALAATVC